MITSTQATGDWASCTQGILAMRGCEGKFDWISAFLALGYRAFAAKIWVGVGCKELSEEMQLSCRNFFLEAACEMANMTSDSHENLRGAFCASTPYNVLSRMEEISLSQHFKPCEVAVFLPPSELLGDLFLSGVEERAMGGVAALPSVCWIREVKGRRSFTMGATGEQTIHLQFTTLA